MRAVLFDIDGTLVDSNDLHTEAWDMVFREAGVAIDRATIRGQIGKGGDLLVPALAPDLDEAAQERVAERHGEVFKERFLDRVRPFPQAHAILERAHAAGLKVAIASSASQGELDHYLKLLDAEKLVDATTTIDDVGTSKPAPDIFSVVLDKLPGVTPAEAMVIGDTPFDIESASKAGVATIAVRSGGFDDAALKGAAAIYDDIADLLARWRDSPLA